MRDVLVKDERVYIRELTVRSWVSESEVSVSEKTAVPIKKSGIPQVPTVTPVSIIVETLIDRNR